MAIRFHCQRCRQMLGIASRKAGSEIACPKCGLSQTVPSEEAAAAAMAMGQFAQMPQSGNEPTQDLVVYDDQPSVIEDPPQSAAHRPDPANDSSGKPAADMPGAEMPAETARATPRDMILFPRRSIYVQGGLFLVLAALAFWTGYLMGYGDGKEQLRVEEKLRQTVFVRGRVSIGTESAGDSGAVIIVLPKDKMPRKKIGSAGIRPGDATRKSHPSLKTIETELGGAYARADAGGNFDMVLPDRGDYYLLIISNRARRAEDARFDEATMGQMENYFERPERLIGRFEFRWMSQKVDGDVRLDDDINFGGEDDL